MKFLWTLLFLGCGGLGLFIGSKNQKLTVEATRGDAAAVVKSYFCSICVLLAGFVQYWALTRVFPLSLILLLIGASLATWMISVFIRAISGLAIQEKKEKIAALALIWSFERGVRHPWLYMCMYGILPLLVMLVSWFLSLWVFWRWPLGDPAAKVWIALFQFTVPQVVLVPAMLGAIWPIVTSEFLDNDVRNSNLIERFSGILYSTLWLLFPLWMLKQEMQTTLGSLPPFWVLLSAPLILFVLGGVAPHVIGMFRFRAKTASLLTWRKRWLGALFDGIKLPEGDLRLKVVDQRMRELKERIEERAAANSLIELYRNVLDDASPLEEESQDAVLPGTAEPPESLPSPAETELSVGVLKPPGTGMLARACQKAWPERRRPQTTQEQIVSIVLENKQRLVEWDVRFADLKELLFLYRVGFEAKAKDVSGFLETQIKRIDDELASLNKVGSFLPKTMPTTLSTLISTLLVGLLKSYDARIVKFVTGLLGSST